LSNFTVYILRSKKDGTIYVGQTNNIWKRIEKHNKGQVKSTKHRIPLELIYKENYATRREAMFREWKLKSVSGINEKKQILARLGL